MGPSSFKPRHFLLARPQPPLWLSIERMSFSRLLLFLLIFPFQALALDPAVLAEKLGLGLILKGNPLTFLETHEVYADSSFSRLLLVVREVPGELTATQILKQKDYLIIQVPGPKHFTSMALIGVSEEEFNGAARTTSLWQRIWRQIDPLPTALAETCTASGAPDLAGMEQLAHAFGTPGMGPLDCLIPMIQGAWEATGGMAVSAVQSIRNLATDPRGWWDSKVEQVKNLREFVMNFGVKMQELGAAFMALPAQTKTMMICMFAGSLGSSVLLSMLSGGAGMAAVMARVNTFMISLLRLERVIALMQRMGKVAMMPAEFFRRLARGEVGDRMLDSLDIFARKNMDDMIVGAMACAI
jgi:hypothetical protein